MLAMNPRILLLSLVWFCCLSVCAVPPPAADVFSEDAALWSVDGGITVTADAALVGAGSISLRAEVDDGFPVTMSVTVPGEAADAFWDLTSAGIVGLAFRARAENPNAFQFQSGSPTVRLHSGAAGYRQLVPRSELLNDTDAIAGFTSIALALGGNTVWSKTEVGEFDPSRVTRLELQFDTWGAQPYTVWIDDIQFVTATSLVLDSSDLVLQEGWRWMNFDPAVPVIGTTLVLPRKDMMWSSSNSDIVAVDSNGVAEMVAPGQATVTGTLDGMSATCDFTVRPNALAPVTNAVPAELATAAAAALFDLPVVILRFLPTLDGINLDVDQARDFYTPGPITLANLEARIARFETRSKFMIEEGSRFRGYARPDAIPSIGLRVVKMITVYEQVPPGDDIYEGNAEGKYRIDYERIFDRFDLRRDIEQGGVKEIWIWNGGSEAGWPSADPATFRPEFSRKVWESNMASPHGVDISNSDLRLDDLPVYNRTYTVYGNNIRRTQAEVVHNRGHQLEAMMSWAAQRQDGNDQFFWNEFTGPDGSGRCGDTHFPPNATVGYNYTDPTFVQSDIEDWKPGGGTVKAINFERWRDLPYAWPATPDFAIPQKTESQYYIYWFQAFPGHANAISYSPDKPGRWLSNWWAFMGDWDMAVAMDLGLHGPAMGSGTPQLSIQRWIAPAEEGIANEIQLHGDVPSGHLPVLESSPDLVQSRWLQEAGLSPGAFTPGFELDVPPDAFFRRFWRLRSIPVMGQ